MREALIDAAERVAMKEGLNRFTLVRVAEEAGVTKQGLLYHFASKDALVFAVYIREWECVARAISAAVAKAKTGAQALKAIISSFVTYYTPRLTMYRLIMQKVQEYEHTPTAEQFAQIRPLNDVMFKRAEELLRAEGRKNPRRLAFCAHLAAIGIMSMKALVENFGDPLLHSDAELVATMSEVFRG